MSVSVSVRSYTHSVTYVAGNILRSLQDIVRLGGLDPRKIASEWSVLERGLKTWIESGDLETVILEVYNPSTDAFIGRWDIEISYSWNGQEGNFWVDSDQIKYAVKKAGLWPSTCKYRIVADTKPGRPDVEGWSGTQLRSTAGFIKQSLGTTIDASGLSASTSYYRRA